MKRIWNALRYGDAETRKCIGSVILFSFYLILSCHTFKKHKSTGMSMISHLKINYMKYITLFLLISVFLYSIHDTIRTNNAIATSSFFANELPIYCVDTEKPVLALTFDSAWGNEDLADILAILKKHNAPAAFFVTGEWAQKYPDAIVAILSSQGCQQID